MGSDVPVPAFQKQVPVTEITKLIDDWFKNYDLEHNEKVTVDEVMKYHQKRLGSHSEVHANALRESIEEEFDKYKKGNNGVITREDLMEYYTKYFDAHPGSITIQRLERIDQDAKKD